MIITDKFSFYVIKGSLIWVVIFTVFVEYDLLVNEEYGIEIPENIYGFLFAMAPLLLIVVLNFVRWSGLEIMRLTDNGIQLKNELVEWDSIQRIYKKGHDGILIVEFSKNSEVYIAKTIVSFVGDSTKAKKVLNKVQMAWANGKERDCSTSDGLPV